MTVFQSCWNQLTAGKKSSASYRVATAATKEHPAEEEDKKKLDGRRNKLMTEVQMHGGLRTERQCMMLLVRLCAEPTPRSNTPEMDNVRTTGVRIWYTETTEWRT